MLEAKDTMSWLRKSENLLHALLKATALSEAQSEIGTRFSAQMPTATKAANVLLDNLRETALVAMM